MCFPNFQPMPVGKFGDAHSRQIRKVSEPSESPTSETKKEPRTANPHPNDPEPRIARILFEHPNLRTCEWQIATAKNNNAPTTEQDYGGSHGARNRIRSELGGHAHRFLKMRIILRHRTLDFRSFCCFRMCAKKKKKSLRMQFCVHFGTAEKL